MFDWLRRKSSYDRPHNELLPGAKIRMGGREWIIPPLNLAALEKYLPLIQSWSGKSSAQRFGEMAVVIHAALRRNYPQLRLSEVRELVDLANVNQIIEAVIAGSGLMEPAPGEAAAGEVPTGAPSMPN